MSTKESAESFLKELKTKISIFSIIFEDRKEFFELQKELEMTQSDCINIIKNLNYKDYYSGPKRDDIHGGEFWEFGKRIKKVDVYIKINIGLANKSVICISFHRAKYALTYPLINK